MKSARYWISSLLATSVLTSAAFASPLPAAPLTLADTHPELSDWRQKKRAFVEAPLQRVSHESFNSALVFSPSALSGMYDVPRRTSHSGLLPVLSATEHAKPEPETYGMLLAGLGLMGAMAWRRINAR